MKETFLIIFALLALAAIATFQRMMGIGTEFRKMRRIASEKLEISEEERILKRKR